MVLIILYCLCLFVHSMELDDLSEGRRVLSNSMEEDHGLNHLTSTIQHATIAMLDAQKMNYRELLRFRNVMNVEPYLPRALLYHIVQNAFDPVSISHANKYKSFNIEEPELHKLLKADKNYYLMEIYSFVLDVFKKYPSLAFHKCFRHFRGTIACLPFLLRMNLVHPYSTDFFWSSEFWDLCGLDGMEIFYHPFLHRQLMFKNIKKFPYVPPRFLSQCLNTSIRDSDDWFLKIDKDSIKPAIKSLRDIEDCNPNELLFTVNTLMTIYTCLKKELYKTVKSVLWKHQIPFFVELERLAPVDLEIDWIFESDCAYINFETAGSDMVCKLLQRGGKAVESARKVIRLMMEYRIPFVHTDGVALCTLTDLALKREELDIFSEIAKEKYHMTSDHCKVMNYKWMNALSQDKLFCELSLVRYSDICKIYSDCPELVYPMVMVNSVIQNIMDFATIADVNEIPKLGNDGIARKEEFEKFIRAERPSVIQKSLLAGLIKNPLFTLVKEKYPNGQFYCTLDIRPLLHWAIDHCHMNFIEFLIQKGILCSGHQYEIDSLHKKKLGAYYVCSLLTGVGTVLEKFICYNPLCRLDWTSFCNYGLHKTFRTHLALIVDNKVRAKYMEVSVFRVEDKFDESIEYDMITNLNREKYAFFWAKTTEVLLNGYPLYMVDFNVSNFHLNYIDFLTVCVNMDVCRGAMYELIRLNYPMRRINGQSVLKCLQHLDSYIVDMELKRDPGTPRFVINPEKVNNYCVRCFGNSFDRTLENLKNENFCREYNCKHFHLFLENFLA